jgi:hypothetical protein
MEAKPQLEQLIASAVLAVDAKDERAREFYLRHDFIPLPSQPNRLFYPVKTIDRARSRSFGWLLRPVIEWNNAVDLAAGRRVGHVQD